MATLGTRISEMLHARGVRTIFGIPGVHNQELYRGIESAGITHVLARHEQGAGFMADGYARATGKVGVAYVISGPGLTNVLTPLGQSYSDSVAVLAISSVLAETDGRRGQLHQMRDQVGAAATVCAWSLEARDADTAYALIDRALGEMATGRPRPRHLSVTIPALEAEADATWASATAHAAPIPPDPARVADVARRLAEARRPVAIFGGGARGAADVSALLARAGIASFTTYAGRGVVADAAPLHFGATLARPSSAEVLAQADLVLAVGTELSEVDLWRDALGHDCPTIRVDIDPEVLAQPGQEPLRADAGLFLAALAEALPEATSDWSPAEVADRRARWRAEVAAERPGLVPVIDALRAALPTEVCVFSDMTQIAYAAKEIWPMPRAGLWHHPFGFGTLGYALPAAIGGKVGLGDAPVVALIGDYGLQYTLPELAVATELGLSLPVILWDNGKLGEIEASMVRAQIAPNAVVQRNPDFGLLAQAYGAGYARPRALDDIAPAVADALAAGRPTILHIGPWLTESD